LRDPQETPLTWKDVSQDDSHSGKKGAGKTQSGSQSYRCMQCGYKYTPEPKQYGYPDEIRKQALQLYLYVNGVNLR
jgi:transposase-like protein